MSYWSRLANVFRRDRLAREIDEELEAHLADAIEQGRDPEEARRALGSRLSLRERSQDVRLATRLDALRADLVFAGRQLRKHRITSAAAILSLALAMGACLAVFRLSDAMLLRPLPVANPGRLFVLTFPSMNQAGRIETAEWFDYPQFRKLRAAVPGDAELLAISSPGLAELTFGADDQMERLRLQFVSGWMFGSFGLKPALGRLLTASDDVTPGANGVAVLSWNGWDRRFGRDPNVIGRRFRFRDGSYEIVGVAEKGFAGTEPGVITDVFVPTMMNAKVIDQPGVAWFRIWAHLASGTSPEFVRQKLKAAERDDRRERAKTRRGDSPARRQWYLASELFLEPAGAGFSALQRLYRRPLAVLALVVVLVLLIACVNVANLMAGHAHARAREMALRVSIGAGRSRLIQLVLTESCLIAVLACGLGSLFAQWAAPFIVAQISPPAAPIAIALTYDWRVSVFSAALVLLATLSFGGIPAWRVSGIHPAAALRGETGPRHRRFMNVLVGVQVAFCVLVLFAAGLFAASVHRLTSQPVGFDPDGLVNLITVTRQDAPLAQWEEIRRELETVPGVTSAALATWPLLFGNRWTKQVSVEGGPPLSEEAYFLATSPGWLRTVRLPLLSGRELREGDPYPGPVLVNQEFVRQYFDGRDPVGRSFRTTTAGKALTSTIVGVVGDARYLDMRESVRATVYVGVGAQQPWFPGAGTFVVRASAADPMSLAATLRQRVAQARPGFRVTEVQTQNELIAQHTIRERLLAMVSLFFAIVALMLSIVGLYGVLSYSVLQRRREIGIRLALGAAGGEVAWSVVAGAVTMLVPGAIAGIAAGIACQRYLGPLLYETKTVDPGVIGLTLAVTITIAFAAVLPAIRRALRVDPSAMLRAD